MINYVNEQIRCLPVNPKKSCSDRHNRLKSALKNLDRPGERKAGFDLKLRNDPMNLLGIMPAKEGGKKSKKEKGKKRVIWNSIFFTFDLLLIEHSFAGVLFVFGKRMIFR